MVDSRFVAAWFWYAVVAAILYGAHQIFTRLAAERIGDGLGGFIVEASAALSILIYLGVLWFGGRWNQKFSAAGFNYSVLTGSLRRRRRHRVLSSISTRRSTFGRTGYFRAAPRSWRSLASYFSMKRHHDSVSWALHLPFPVCFYYPNNRSASFCRENVNTYSIL
jgi:hypothetical protein